MEVAEEASTIKGVKIAHAVTGEYDVVLYVEFLNISELSEIISRVQSINGVVKTATAIAMVPRIT